MTDPLPTTARSVARASRMHPLAKVAFLWTMLAVLFAAFNLVYWPRYQRQTLKKPESFMAYADTLPEEEARRVLQQGISRFNPPWEEPYARLAALETRTGNAAAAKYYRGRADFYRALHGKTTAIDMLSALALAFSEPYANIGPSAARAVGAAAASFCEAMGMRGLGDHCTLPQQIALFALGGGAVAPDGRIGGTEIKAPLPLLAYSGGGRDKRRGAHLFVGDTDYASELRGMHIVLLDGDRGAVIQAERFDLWDSTEEASRMALFLDKAPQGCIGLFAVCDEGSAFMTNAIEAGFLHFGIEKSTFVGGEPRILGLRYSFAAIGVKGAPPGSALQAWSPDRFQKRRGHPVVCAAFPAGVGP